ncbi:MULTISPECIES: ribonuclease P protein component [Calditerrivibrio]|uniref:Ribonuclease P protein component n=1 Tax=Calditerrivibrio nitroreducens TaxID=477976 RepID=A0A2J6WIX8_9BACT|nr:MAG: ribonuclease P protein component [Calditerrivibrio nitroreducens]
MGTVEKNERFPKEVRLRKQLEFKYLFKKGKKIYFRYCCIFYIKGSGRVGLVVGKKVSKNSADRNLIKRRLRHIYRTNKEIFKNLDLVILALPSSLKATYWELLDDITQNVKKINDRDD